MTGQTGTESFVEAFFSNVLSYMIDVAFVLLIAPMVGIEISVTVITGGVALLYGIHLIKSFFYRRFWNKLLIRRHKRLEKTRQELNREDDQL